MPTPRSVKIGDDERGGWSSDRPRRATGGAPRPADIGVRCRVLAPTDRLRYMPGSTVVIASGSPAARDAFAERVVEDRGAIISVDRVRALLAGRVPDEEVEAKAAQLLDAAITKRLEARQSVIVLAPAGDAELRERVARLAHKHRSARHFVLVEAPRDEVPDDARAALNELRRALDGGELGAEGFHTALRLGGGAIGELKRIVFRPPPEEE